MAMTKRAWVFVVALLAIVPGSTCRKADITGSMDVPVTMKPGQWVSFAGARSKSSFCAFSRTPAAP
jgi:hypothetical protein